MWDLILIITKSIIRRSANAHTSQPELASPVRTHNVQTWPRGYKTYSCSTQLSTKFQLLIKTEIPTNEEISCFKSVRCCIHRANKC